MWQLYLPRPSNKVYRYDNNIIPTYFLALVHLTPSFMVLAEIELRVALPKWPINQFKPNWHEGWYFYLLVIFESDFSIETFQTFLRWKFKSIGLFWHSAQFIESLSLGCIKDGHFSFTQSSCQFGLNAKQLTPPAALFLPLP